MAIKIYGGTTILPLEADFAASQEKTQFVFVSHDSGSYIYSGSNPTGSQSGSITHHTSSLTFEDSGSLFSFVFSGSGYASSSGLPGTLLSASINGLSSSADIAAAFTASVVASTNMTASILVYTSSTSIYEPTLISGSGGFIVELINSGYTSSSITTSSFAASTLGANTIQRGHSPGYLSGSDTTGSLIISGNLSVSGSVLFGSSDNEVIGDDSFTLGTSLIASGSSQTVVGKYNTKGDDKSPFIVGSGASKDNRLTMFKVSTSGSISIPYTSSGAPSWSGSDGELIPATVGGNHYLYMWMGSSWKSSSFA